MVGQLAAATWDGYTAGAVVAGAVTILTVFLPRRSIGMRAISLLVGAMSIAYGVFVANQTSGTYKFPAAMFALPVFTIIEAAVSQRRSGHDRSDADGRSAAAPVKKRSAATPAFDTPAGRTLAASGLTVAWFAVDLFGRILVFSLNIFEASALSFGAWQRFNTGSYARYRPMVLPLFNNDLAFHLLFAAAVVVLATKTGPRHELAAKVATVLAVATAFFNGAAALQLTLDRSPIGDWQLGMAMLIAIGGSVAAAVLFISGQTRQATPTVA